MINNLALGNANGAGIWPYAEVTMAALPPSPALPPPSRYPNRDTFQIVSAGADHIFGSGSMPVYYQTQPNNPLGFAGFLLTWTSVNPPVAYGSSNAQPNGADDQSNFSSGLLGANDQ
jgi:hypothetical protein